MPAENLFDTKKVLDTPEGKYLANRAEKMRKGFGMNTADYGSYADGGFTTPIVNGSNLSTNVFVTLEMSDEQMTELATRLALGVEAGAVNGTIIGNQESLRRADRAGHRLDPVVDHARDRRRRAADHRGHVRAALRGGQLGRGAVARSEVTPEAGYRFLTTVNRIAQSSTAASE